VPVPQSGEVPEVLRAYCGEAIAPGCADLLTAISGMPCQSCLAASPVPLLALPRTPRSPVAPEWDDTGWWDLGLRSDQKITARFVLLLLLQDPDRDWSVAEVAARLGHDPHTVNLILL